MPDVAPVPWSLFSTALMWKITKLMREMKYTTDKLLDFSWEQVSNFDNLNWYKEQIFIVESINQYIYTIYYIVYLANRTV